MRKPGLPAGPQVQFRTVPFIFAMTLALAANAASAAEFTAKDLAAEEGKFAAYSVKHGMRDAFVEFFADDSVLLRPDPVEGRPFMRARTNPPIVLDWKSQITVLSASRDIGMSTGPSIVNAKGQPTSYGQFFSIWQKQKNGDWRVLLDHGISHGEKAAPDTPLDARDLPAGPVAASTGDDAEMRFAARTADAGVAIAYAEAVTDRTRLLRVDSVPIQGVAAINALAKNMEGKWTWETLKKGTSQAHDFLYVLGKYKRQTGAGPAQQGHFIRVWIQDTQSGVARWTLAGEVLTPRPAPKT